MSNFRTEKFRKIVKRLFYRRIYKINNKKKVIKLLFQERKIWLSFNKKKIKRFFFFAPILPEFVNNIIGNSLDLFLTYSEEIVFNLEDKTSKTLIEQVNNFYNGRYDVKYTKIDEENTTIDITFTFELLLQSYSLFTFSAIIETIISQIFCAEMKTFYNNLGNDIKEFYNNKDLNQNNDDLNEIKIKKHKKPKKIVS